MLQPHYLEDSLEIDFYQTSVVSGLFLSKQLQLSKKKTTFAALFT
jgi:hypothetical protein